MCPCALYIRYLVYHALLLGFGCIPRLYTLYTGGRPVRAVGRFHQEAAEIERETERVQCSVLLVLLDFRGACGAAMRHAEGGAAAVDFLDVAHHAGRASPAGRPPVGRPVDNPRAPGGYAVDNPRESVDGRVDNPRPPRVSPAPVPPSSRAGAGACRHHAARPRKASPYRAGNRRPAMWRHPPKTHTYDHEAHTYEPKTHANDVRIYIGNYVKHAVSHPSEPRKHREKTRGGSTRLLIH